MARRLAAFLPLPVSLLLALIAAPAVLAGDPCYHGFVMPAQTEEAATQIKVAPCAFGPTVAHVAVGASVTFFNGPDETHLITGANQAWGSRDVELRPGQTVAYRFEKPGIYPYACALHRGMSGAIVVGGVTAAGGTTGATENDTATAATAGESGMAAGVALGSAAGLAVGAAAAWLALRRRPRSVEAIGPAE